MVFVEGHGVLGRVQFVDGTMPSYNRTYLVVNVSNDYIELLNVSSIKGKERKLAFPTNEQLLVYNPPFLKPSFVKLDSLVRVAQCDWGGLTILNQGTPLNRTELNRIKALLA